jgi:hypothetical protein
MQQQQLLLRSASACECKSEFGGNNAMKNLLSKRKSAPKPLLLNGPKQHPSDIARSPLPHAAL